MALSILLERGTGVECWSGVESDFGVANVGHSITEQTRLLILVVAALHNSVLHSGVQPGIHRRIYGGTHRMKQYSLIWFKHYFDCFNYKIISTIQHFPESDNKP